MRQAVIRGLCAFACALVFHAALVAVAVRLGWLSPGHAIALPELDLTSVDLSFSETPDETAAPAALPPAPPVKEHILSPPPPESHLPDHPTLDERLHWDNGRPASCMERTGVSPVRGPVTPPPAEPRPTVLRPPLPEPPEADHRQEPTHQPQQPASASAPSQARVAVDKPPTPRHRIKPEYPKGARQRGEEGDVALELDISAAGTVDDVRVIGSCGFAELEQAAIQAVKRARFNPARRGSTCVPSTASLTLAFRLKD